MNQELIEKLKKMKKVDQGARFDSLKAGDFAKYTIYVVDAGNGHLIHRIIETYGYPTKEMVGEEGLKDFWLLVQHQDFDNKLQEDCLKNCEFGLEEKAMLTDRVLVGQGKKQIYGTQFHKVNDKLVPRPIEDEIKLDELRKSVGLESMEEYKQKMENRDIENKKIKEENQGK